MGTTKVDNALKARTERAPVPYIQDRSFSNQTWMAVFATYDGDAVSVLADMTPGEVWEIFLFTQDVPIWVFAYSYYPASTQPFVDPHPAYPEVAMMLNTPAAAQIVTAINNADGYTVVTASTLTNAIDVLGYYGTVSVLDHGLENAQGVIEPQSVQVYMTAAGAVVWGPPAIGVVGAGPVSYIPILLAESQYTQAMKDAGDVIVVGVDRYQIVGLYMERIAL